MLISESLNETIPIEEAYKQIDEIIEKYQLSISTLKSHRNRYAPISRFPPEIMCRIFAYTQTNGSYYSALRWVKQTTHITRCWRNIAINSPSLWVNLPIDGNPLRLELHLERSKDASLVIDCDLHDADYSEGLFQALKHITRVKELCLRNVSSNMWINLEKVLPESARRLQCLVVNGSAHDQFSVLDILESNFLTIRVLCDTGRLRHVELVNCNIDWNTHILRSLVHLKFHNIPATCRPTGRQFVDMLRGMPDLEFLDLQDVFPPDTSIWPSNSCVHFASLQTLNMSCTDHAAENFFVTFPPTAAVTVLCSVARNSAAVATADAINFSGFISGLARSYSTSSTVFRSIALEQIYDPLSYSSGIFGTDIHFCTRSHKDFQFPQGKSFNPNLKLSLDALAHTLPGLISKFMTSIFSGALNLQHVEQVYIGSSIALSDLMDQTLSCTLGTLPNCRSVLLKEDSCEYLISALRQHSPPKSTNSSTSKSSMSFLHLSSIIIQEANFGSADGKLTPEFLRECLIQRSESGAPVEKLTIESCKRIGEDDVDLLKEIVVDVGWDGEVSFTDTEEEEDYDHEHNEYCDSYDGEDSDYYGYW